MWLQVDIRVQYMVANIHSNSSERVYVFRTNEGKYTVRTTLIAQHRSRSSTNVTKTTSRKYKTSRFIQFQRITTNHQMNALRYKIDLVVFLIETNLFGTL